MPRSQQSTFMPGPALPVFDPLGFSGPGPRS
jgi:hypothetical protein